MATKKFPITQKQFREWVHAKPNRRYGGSGSHCPLAKCLNERTRSKGQMWWVGVFTASTEDSVLDPDHQFHHLPKWAETFVRRFDDRKKGVKAVDLI